MGVVASATFSGAPWDVFRANGLVYDFVAGKVKKLSEIDFKLVLFDAGEYYTSSGLIMAGSSSKNGQRVTDYLGKRIWSSEKFNYSSVVLE